MYRSEAEFCQRIFFLVYPAPRHGKYVTQIPVADNLRRVAQIDVRRGESILKDPP